MHILDDAKTFIPESVEAESLAIDCLADDVRTAWRDVQELIVQKSFAKAQTVLFLGGGEAMSSARMLCAAFAQKSKIPFLVEPSGHIPTWVGSQTLVVIAGSSTHGAPLLTAAEEAHKKKAKIIVLSSIKTLNAWAKANEVPYYALDAQKSTLGSFLGAMSGALVRAQALSMKEEDMRRALAAMSEVTDLCASDIASSDNPAKQVAMALNAQEICIVGVDHLSGNARACAKDMSLVAVCDSILSLENSTKYSSEKCVTLFLNSSLYHAQTRKLLNETADSVEDAGGAVVDYVARGKDCFEEVCEVFQFLQYVGWYVALAKKE